MCKTGRSLEPVEFALLGTVWREKTREWLLMWISFRKSLSTRLSTEVFPHINKQFVENHPFHAAGRVLLTSDPLLEIIDLAHEVRLDGEVFADLAAGVHDGGMVAIAKLGADLGQCHI